MRPRCASTFCRAEELQRAFPILVDRFLENATEVDVDALADGTDVVVAGIMQHIEEAGIHSGDSSCVLPSVSIPEDQRQTLRDYTVRLARELKVVGLMNVQYAIQNGKVYVLEVNPRASRTVPYVSKATGFPLAKIAVAADGGPQARGIRPAAGIAGQPFLCKIAGFPLPEIAGCGHDPRTGDEIHR